MAGEVRLIVDDIGDVLDWSWDGVDPDGVPWEQSALDIALAMVPHLMEAIDRAHIKGVPVVATVSQSDGESA